jgi:gas vesicle structural protein
VSGPLLRDDNRKVSLVEALDRVLSKGAVVAGDIVISVADVDLIRLQLNLVVGSTGSLKVSAQEGPLESARVSLKR